MKNNKFRVLIIVFFLMSLSLSVSSVRAESVLHFSDIISGPKTGLGDGLGEGAIITIWGNNLGSFQGSSKVYFKDSLNHVYESAYVYYWVNADGQSGGGPADLYTFHKMQEIAFSIPSSVTDGLGKMYVEVGGINSNELNFTVREGNIYFVDINSTNDPGIGTYSDSWRSPKTFYNNAQAGDICYFSAGTYNGTYGYSSGGGNFVVNVGSGNGYTSAGTEENPISYISYPGEIITFDALGETAPTSNFRVFSPGGDPEWYVISKLNFKAYNSCIGSASTGWRVVGNDAEGITRTTALWAGIIGTGGGSAKILGNNVHGGRSGSKMDHAIYPGGCPSAGGIEVAWNHIYDNSFARGPLISVNHESNRCEDTEYVDDIYIHDNIIDSTNYPCRGISIFHMSYATGDPVEPTAYIYNNIFINGGITDEYGPQPAIVQQNAHSCIYNNTFYNTRTRAIALYSYVGASSYPLLSTTIKNNIFHIRSDADTYIYVDYNIEDSKVIIDSNCYYGKGSYSGNDSNAINSNPLFINSATNDFRLQSTSQAIDNGTSSVSSVVSTDFDGNSRPMDGDENGTAEYDIGAYEYTGIYIPPVDITPPTCSDPSPAESLSSGTTQIIISLTTDENAVCKYSTTPGTDYSLMQNTFSTTNSTTHSTLITGLEGGNTYTCYIRSKDIAGNTNSDDFLISFEVDNSDDDDANDDNAGNDSGGGNCFIATSATKPRQPSE